MDNDIREIEKRTREFWAKEKIYSFNSIVYAVNLIFKQEKYIPKYDLILIDEFQDFNKCEYELIRFLGTQSRMVLVGDDNQALYEDFRKARPEQIRNLYKDIKNDNFCIDYCYRCTQVIVNAASELITNAKKIGYLRDYLEKKFLF